MFVAAALAAAAMTQEAPPSDAASSERLREILCGCAAATPAETLLEGVVVDAELTLSPDGRTANQRQATIFTILNALDVAAGARVKIFHDAQAQCGVTFDYGKRYRIRARPIEDGAFETDYCLMNDLAPRAGAQGASADASPDAGANASADAGVKSE